MTRLLESTLFSAPLDEGRGKLVAPGGGDGDRVPTRGSRPQDDADAMRGPIDSREETGSLGHQ